MTDETVRADARALRRTIARLQRSFRQTRDAAGPTPAQLSALGTLHRDGPMATGVLAERERLKPQSVTRLVAALAELGYLERFVDADDRRRQVVAITSEGRRRLAREMMRREERLVERLEQFTSKERGILRAACALIERLSED